MAAPPPAEDLQFPPPLPPSFPAMGRFWTLANGLSLARLVLVGPIAVMVYQGGPFVPMIGLILLAVATDWFDGRVARWSGTVSEWGKVLDATADKLAAGAVALALLFRPEAAGPTLPLWFAALVIARDVLLAVGGLIQTRRLGRFTTSLWTGKWAVGALAVTVLAALLRADPEVMQICILGTAAIMAVSVVHYGIRFQQILRYGPRLTVDDDGNVLRDQRGAGAREREGVGD